MIEIRNKVFLDVCKSIISKNGEYKNARGGSTGDNRVSLLSSSTEKSISHCLGRSAANLIRGVNESMLGLCSKAQCKRERWEQLWRYVGNARKGAGWHLGTGVLVSAGQRRCLLAQCGEILQGIILLLKSFTSLGIVNKNFNGKKIWGWKMKFWNDKVKLSYDPVPAYVITSVCRTGSKAELDTPSWVSYGGALSDSLQRLDGMHSMRHVAAQQTMSIEIKVEKLPHLLSTSILYVEQAWVPASDCISYIYIYTACGCISMGSFIRLGYVLDSRQI